MLNVVFIRQQAFELLIYVRTVRRPHRVEQDYLLGISHLQLEEPTYDNDRSKRM